MQGEIVTIRAIDVRKTTSFPHERGKGRVLRGLRMIFVGGKPFTAANDFMQDEAMGTAADHKDWRNTADARADDLVQFLYGLQALNLDWSKVTKADFERLRTLVRDRVSPTINRRNKKSSNRRRFSTVRAFYRYATERGLLLSGAFDGNYDLRKSVWSATSSSPTSVEEFIGSGGDRVNPMTLSDCGMVLAALGPEKAESGDGARDQRDRLFAETSFLTGMRGVEVEGLTAAQIMHLYASASDRKNPYQIHRLWIERTKGSRPRWVMFPFYLLERLVKYIEGERLGSILRARELGRFPNGREPKALFLNSVNANHRDVGRPCKASTVSRAVTRVMFELGLTSVEDEVIVSDDGASHAELNNIEAGKFVRPNHTFHDFRHTFAVQVYWQNKLRGVSEPWKDVQVLLGHKSLLTTLNTYLKWANVHEPEISDMFKAMMARLDEMLRQP